MGDLVIYKLYISHFDYEELKLMRNQDDPYGFILEKLGACDYCKGDYALSLILYYKRKHFLNYYAVWSEYIHITNSIKKL